MPDRLIDAVVVIPVRSFATPKARLAPALSLDARVAVTVWMAETVVAAAGDLPVVIVTDDDAVARWAHGLGCRTAAAGEPGLDAAARAGLHQVQGWARYCVVVHADLPLADDVSRLLDDGITLVPDRHGDGTNVLCLPTGLPFDFSYGPGSFERHCLQATSLSTPVRVLTDRRFGWDVDTPPDLVLPADLAPAGLQPPWKAA